jgi:hypothetical protein
VGIGGNTALASQTVETLRSDLVRIGIVALLVNFVLLLAFLARPSRRSISWRRASWGSVRPSA